MPHPDLAAEQAHVDHAYERLEAMRETALAMLRAAFSERGGTFQAITERDIRVRTSLNRLEQLQIGRESLVFGRIDRLAADGADAQGGTDTAAQRGLGGGRGHRGDGGGLGGQGDGRGRGRGGRNSLGGLSGPVVADLGHGYENGEAAAGPESFHIGRLAVADDDQEPLVVDWRAPVAEPFYRATGAQPMGLTLRRHFLTEGRRVLDLEDEIFANHERDDDGNDDTNTDTDADAADDRAHRSLGAGLSGSATLLAALSRSRTGRMRDIVATVQREQDEIIRSPLSGVLVVQGGPGTGKTAVALHRAAYLLYTFRFPLESQGVLVVGPNPLFLRYIEHVLPSLGETGVEMSTVARLYGPIVASGADDRATAMLKGDPRMARFLARAVASRQRPLRRSVEVPFGPVILTLSANASAEIVRAAKRRAGTHNARRRFVEQQLWRHLHARLLEARARPAVRPLATDSSSERALFPVPDSAPGPIGPGGRGQAGDTSDRGDHGDVDESLAPVVALPPPVDISVTDLGNDLRRLPVVSEALDRMWPRLTPQELLHDLFGAPPLVELAGRDLLSDDEQRLLLRPRSASPEVARWTDADLPLLDEARALLGSIRRRSVSERDRGRDGDGGTADEDLPRSYGHIVVDEAQDLSPMQWRMLARRSLSWSMTIVGDIAQATGAWAPPSWTDALAHLQARKGVRVVELTVNYRTPGEVMELAGRVLQAAAPGMVVPQSVRTTGDLPRVLAAGVDTWAAETAQAVAIEASEAGQTGDQGGTVGVICAPSMVGEAAEALRHAEVVFGTLESGALDDTVTLVSVTAVKGLEFDSVVVVEPSQIVAESVQGLPALYVALTRATRRLTIVHRDPLPEPLGA